MVGLLGLRPWHLVRRADAIMDLKTIVRLMLEAKCTVSQIMHVTGLTYNGLKAVREELEM